MTPLTIQNEDWGSSSYKWELQNALDIGAKYDYQYRLLQNKQP